MFYFPWREHQIHGTNDFSDICTVLAITREELVEGRASWLVKGLKVNAGMTRLMVGGGVVSVLTNWDGMDMWNAMALQIR